MSRSADSDPRLLLHGTSPLAAVGIAVEGFRLAPVALRFWGRGALGDGIYLTRSHARAREFTRDFEQRGDGVVIRVGLAPGTRLLWLDGRYEPSRIDSLRREFGAAILKPAFHKAIPRNKHLRARELIDLLNYRYSRGDEPSPLWQPGWDGIAGVRQQLRRAKYAGFGCARSDLGVVVFDPAVLTAERFERIGSESAAAAPRVAEPTWLATTAAAQLRELEADHAEMVADSASWWDTAAEADAARSELERSRRQLATFAARHGITLPDDDGATEPASGNRR